MGNWMHPQGPNPGPLDNSNKRWGPQCEWWLSYLPGREGMGTQRTATLTHWPPSTGRGCRMSYQYLSHCVATGYSEKNTFGGKAMVGKTEVSLEQWYQGVQCVKDHYLEPVVWESIVWLLKGAVADMAWYMGPTTSMAHILQTLTIIFGTVVSFNILMQNFYEVIQGNHEKVPSFSTRLEGTLNHIRLQCPGTVTDLKVQQHLKDCLYHGVHKHIRDFIRYL